MKFYEKRAEIREALWLWCLLNSVVKVSADKWWTIDSGQPYSDESIAAIVNVPAATIARWRARLAKAGMIRACKVDRRWSYEVLNPDFKETSATPVVLQRFRELTSLPN